MESKFVVLPRGGSNDKTKAGETTFYRAFQKHMVRRVGRKITSIQKFRMSGEDKYPEFQQIADQYGVVVDQHGMHFYKFVQNSRVLIAIMENKSASPVDLKKWLIMMMEFGEYNGSLSPNGCQWLQLYVLRDDLLNVKDLLKNLNWIGGEVVQNFGNHWADDDTQICWTDDKYVVFRFEC